MTTAVAERDPIYATDFVKEMLRQLRALDSYGVWDGQPIENILAPLVHLTHEGFGRVLITVGKLVALDRSLRDVHRFGFDSLSKMKTEADKMLAVALERVGRYSEVAGL